MTQDARHTNGGTTGTVDPALDYYEAEHPARLAGDREAQYAAAVRLACRTAYAALRTMDVRVPEKPTVLSLLALAQSEMPARVGSFDAARRSRAEAAVKDLYRAFWWLVKSKEGFRAAGSVVTDAPYRDRDHLMSALSGAATTLLHACPAPHEPVTGYVSAWPSPSSSATFLVEDEDDIEEACEPVWDAAHHIERVEEWPLVEGELEEDAEWLDIVVLSDAEACLYSTRVRDAVESVRQEGDTHAWLPVSVRRGEERRDYWLLNVWGSRGAGTWGLRADLVAGRTVVMPAAGDGDPVFAQRAREAADRAGVGIAWSEAS